MGHPRTVTMRRACLIALFLASATGVARLCAGEVSTGLAIAPPQNFAATRSFLEEHCYDCHDADTQKGKFRMDQLTGDLDTADAVKAWSRIVTRLEAGEMPPPKRNRPP